MDPTRVEYCIAHESLESVASRGLCERFEYFPETFDGQICVWVWVDIIEIEEE